MENTIYIVIFGLLIFIVVNNLSLLKRYKNNKNYIACYREVLKGEQSAYTHIDEYIAGQKNEEYANKARVLKLLLELKDDLDYTATLNCLDLRKVYYNKKGAFDKNLVVFNSDTFIFIMMAMSKAYAKLKLNVVSDLYEKVKALVELNSQVEYLEIISLYEALLNKNENGIAFLNCLLNGEYTNYQYDKNMVGIYKRIASATLIFKGQVISDYDNEDLKTFARSLIGKEFLSDLGLYDKYVSKDGQ